MIIKLKKKKFIYRKLKLSDYKQFNNLFYKCFKKKISFSFYKWRYFYNDKSFCYGVFLSSELIANVGIVSFKINDSSQKRIFSRHTSMVLKKYRGQKIFSNLLKTVKQKILHKTKLIVTWPNKNNFSSFGFDTKQIFSKKFYIYVVSQKLKKLQLLKIIKNYKIENLIRLKIHSNINDSFFFKNYNYYKRRYLSYQKEEYFINKFQLKGMSSFFILKKKQKSNLDCIVLDHFGSKKIKSRHFFYLVNSFHKLTFLSKKKINKPNFHLLNFINFQYASSNKLELNQKKNSLYKKEIYLGDTDTFISYEKK